MQDDPNCTISIEILNSLLQLNTIAMRPHDIEANVLPQYDQYKLAYDENTYAILAKYYLNKRDLNKVIELFDKSQEAKLKPVNKMLASYLEAGLRQQDTKTIIHAL